MTADTKATRAAQGASVVLLALCAGQFLMALDSSVMNVSITQIASDLGTNIQGVQLAITAYTLVMAAFMLGSAKLGDIWGRDRAFAIGLVARVLSRGARCCSDPGWRRGPKLDSAADPSTSSPGSRPSR